MKTLNAHISIHRTRSNMGDGCVTIVVEDVLSRCVMVEVSVSPAVFAESLFGLSAQECVAEFNDSGVVGMIHEHKTEDVFVPNHGWKSRAATVRAAIAPYEVDGWKGDDSDAQNVHRRVTSGDRGVTFRVSFHRHVPAPESA